MPTLEEKRAFVAEHYRLLSKESRAWAARSRADAAVNDTFADFLDLRLKSVAAIDEEVIDGILADWKARHEKLVADSEVNRLANETRRHSFEHFSSPPGPGPWKTNVEVKIGEGAMQSWVYDGKSPMPKKAQKKTRARRKS